MWIRKDEASVVAMQDEALTAIGDGDLDRAEALAAELVSLGWSGGYEIHALAAQRRGDLNRAIDWATRGTSAAPDAWNLHLLEGTLRSQARNTSAALAAFERALAIPGCDRATVCFNRGVTRLAAGDAGGALADAEAVLTGSETTALGVATLRLALDALAQLNRHDDALKLVEHITRGAPETPELLALRARALARHGGDTLALAAAIARAIEADAAGPDLIDALARSARAAEAATGRFRVLIDVTAGGLVEGATGYYRTTLVDARDDDDAVRQALSLEPSARRSQVRVERVDALGPAGGPRAIVGTQRAFYGE